jgi:hypothetical protein
MEGQNLSQEILGQLKSVLQTRVTTEKHFSFGKIARSYLQIKTEDNRVIPFDLRPLQKKYLAHKRMARMKGKKPWFLLLKYRRGGFTTLEQGQSYWIASRNRNLTVMTIAQDLKTTKRLFRIALLMHERDPKAPILRGVGNQSHLDFSGLNSFFFVDTAGKKGLGRGDTLTRVHWSEVAFSCEGTQQLVEQRRVITGLSEAAQHGEMVLETTPNGSELFKELYVDAKAGKNEWVPIFLPWYIDPLNGTRVDDDEEDYEIMHDLSDEEERLVEVHNLNSGQVKWRRSKKKQLKHLFYQEYPEDDESCWLVSGIPFFDVKILMKLRDYCRSPEMEDDPNLGQIPKGAKLYPGGYEVVWERPLPNVQYVMGVDTSEGLPGCDYNGIGVMRRDNGKQVASLHGLFQPRILAQHVCRMASIYNNALTGIERENHGHAVIQKVMELGLYRPHYRGGNLYFHSVDRIRDGKTSIRAGWTTSPITRSPMLEYLREWMESENALSRIMDRQFLIECMTFRLQTNGKFEHDSGCHDDSIMKWAIANEMRRQDWRKQQLTVRPMTRWFR